MKITYTVSDALGVEETATLTGVGCEKAQEIIGMRGFVSMVIEPEPVKKKHTFYIPILKSITDKVCPYYTCSILRKAPENIDEVVHWQKVEFED